MASTKVIATLFMAALLLSSCGATSRPGPAEAPDVVVVPADVTTSEESFEGHTFDPMIDRLDPASFAASTSHKLVEGHDTVEQDLCEGLGENDCLTRRTLEAHLDYIYTQEHNN
ncbi:unnamed protein product [Linum trigynum]|uniref:Phytosulfokine n=1 Tax=Linum trigynum TaxID=586398 RepID=A0AAV2E5E3_9ROSI